MKPAKIDVYPELRDTLAELTADGLSQSKIAETMGVSDRGTVAAWQKRPDIQAKVTKIIQERANRILSHATRKLEKKLEQAGDKVSIDTLLKIYEKFHGTTLRVNPASDPAEALRELLQAADSDPTMAAALQALVPDPAGDAAPED